MVSVRATPPAPVTSRLHPARAARSVLDDFGVSRIRGIVDRQRRRAARAGDHAAAVAGQVGGGDTVPSKVEGRLRRAGADPRAALQTADDELAVAVHFQRAAVDGQRAVCDDGARGCGRKKDRARIGRGTKMQRRPGAANIRKDAGQPERRA